MTLSNNINPRAALIRSNSTTTPTNLSAPALKRGSSARARVSEIEKKLAGEALKAEAWTGKGVKAFDNFILGSPEGQFLADWFTQNGPAVENSVLAVPSVAASLKSDAFATKANIVIKGLDELSKIHPFISVAIIAFKLVITLEEKRRSNNAKVLAVNIQMQEMMSQLFRLRHINFTEDEVADAKLLKENQLQSLMQKIANDIKACGSACDLYLKKGFLAKYFKSPVYESELAGFASKFQSYGVQLEQALTVHMVMGVDLLNKNVGLQASELQTMEKKLDMMLVFRLLDTKQEKDVSKFVHQNGGAKAVIGDDTKLSKLLDLAKEPQLDSASTNSPSSPVDPLVSNRREILKEMDENIEDVMKKNLALFETKLDIQNSKVVDAIAHEGQQIRFYDHIQDPHLRGLWQGMRWKANVKAKYFVTTLRDFFADELFLDVSIGQNAPQHPSEMFKQDMWALRYIGVAYLRPIREAIDIDCSGFINVKRANGFTGAAPPGWTLLQWLAFWAVGSHLSISNYKSQIYRMVKMMYQRMEQVLPANRRIVDEYLDHSTLGRLEALLRHTKSLTNNAIRADKDICKLTDSYMQLIEKDITSKLSSLSYTLDDLATVSLIFGSGSIEQYMFPTLKLLISQHLSVIQLACHHVLDSKELSSATGSLVSLFTAFDDRIQLLEAIYGPVQAGLNDELESRFFGMFSIPYGEMVSPKAAENSFLKWQDDGFGAEAQALISQTVLQHGVQDTMHFELYPSIPTRITDENVEDCLAGPWVGHCFGLKEDRSSLLGLMHFWFVTPIDGKVVQGTGECNDGIFSISGNIADPNNLEFDVSFTNGLRFKWQGTLDPVKRIIGGHWSDSDGQAGTVSFSQTPPEFFEFKYTDAAFAANPARARWSFATAAASQEARRRLFAWSLVKKRCSQRRSYLEIRAAQLTSTIIPSAKQDLEWKNLRLIVEPTLARLYHTIAQDRQDRLPYELEVATSHCDQCGTLISTPRLQCITCVNDGFTDCINLCGNCMDASPSTGKFAGDENREQFNHSVSHTLLKFTHFMHGAQRAVLIPAARALSRRIQASAVQGQASTCISCNKNITLPFWACVSCCPATLVCLDCDRKGLQASVSLTHNTSHEMIRIQDLASVKSDTAPTSAQQLEQELSNAELKIERRLIALEKVFRDVYFSIFILGVLLLFAPLSKLRTW